MKKNSTTSASAYLKAALLALVLFMATSILKAQINIEQITGTADVSYSKSAVENLILNIESENPGVSRSAIYYSGYYKVKETVPALAAQMKREKDPSTRILIALSLYKLGDSDGLELIKGYSQKDPDAKVRRMCSAIFAEYLTGSGRVAANKP